VSDTGVVMVARQTVAVVVACDDGPRTARRTNTLPIRNLKANRPRKAGQ
jgi:hypothetical protein